jgi:AAA domain
VKPAFNPATGVNHDDEMDPQRAVSRTTVIGSARMRLALPPRAWVEAIIALAGSESSRSSGDSLASVLIWINGAFGSGKTLVAHGLQRRLRDAHVADPELLGFSIHRMLPAGARQDFQDLPQWRSGVLTTLIQAEAACDGPLIVPMSIVRDDYFDEIVGGLRSSGVDLRHYALTASRDSLHRRLHWRSAYLIGRALGRDETWAIQQIERCVTALDDVRYATQVPTDDRAPDELVEFIAGDAGLELIRPRLSPARERLYRIEIGIRHIRL